MKKQYYLCDIVDADKCKGCTNCVRNCPTEAIRVRKGTSVTISEYCINCGSCIKICPYHAKMAVTDPFDLNHLKEYKYNIALVSPVLYSQFNQNMPLGKVLSSLKSLGFDEIAQESLGADCSTIAIREYLKQPGIRKPVISASCPAVVSLIQIRFPDLVENILPLLPPMEMAAKLARSQAVAKTGLLPEDIGIFLITPCTAKTNYTKNPAGLKKSNIDGTITLIHIYSDIMNAMADVGDTEEPLTDLYGTGLSWARSGGETTAIGPGNYLVADGLSNVISLLQEVELGRFDDLDYLECLICHVGCVGGPLTLENAYKGRIVNRNLVNRLPARAPADFESAIQNRFSEGFFNLPGAIDPRPAVFNMAEDIHKAIQRVSRSEEILKGLPGLNCAACGSPNCRALAEDIARGYASTTDCILILLDTFQRSTEGMLQLLNKARRNDKNRSGKENTP
ncbi:MAG TPA: [Fe-Fe] hydrogenase large subunit C-terminal domain-containing protein [Bacillota bacterium]|nr:[Fe-Fe] hydrogenase large subunit C-terminal domain-containing protein [Bacillota bacterium]